MSSLVPAFAAWSTRCSTNSLLSCFPLIPFHIFVSFRILFCCMSLFCRVVAFSILFMSCHLSHMGTLVPPYNPLFPIVLDKSKTLLRFFTWCYMTTSLGCSHVLFMSSLFPSRRCNTPNLFWSDNWNSFTIWVFQLFSIGFFCLCFSYFQCQITLIFATNRWWSKDISAPLFALTSSKDDLYLWALYSNVI